MIARYISSFHLKNPTATEHDFWVIFVALWSFSFGIISSFVYAYLPGRNPSTNYICLGEIPKYQIKLFPKVNYPMGIVLLLTLLIWSTLGVRLIIFKLSPPVATIESPVHGCIRYQNIQNAKNYINTNSFSLIYILIYIVLTIPGPLALTVDLEKINTFPNFFWVYYFHLCLQPLYGVVTLTILLIKNNPMRAFVYRHFLNIFWI